MNLKKIIMGLCVVASAASLTACGNSISANATVTMIPGDESTLTSNAKITSGVYDFVGYIGSNKEYVFRIENTEDKKNFTLSTNETGIPHYISKYTSDLQIKLTIKKKAIESWQLLDKSTGEDLTGFTEEQLEQHFNPSGAEKTE